MKGEVKGDQTPGATGDGAPRFARQMGGDLGRLAEIGKLTPREAAFILARVRDHMTLADAYLSVLPADHPEMTEGNARRSGWRMEKRVKDKIDFSLLMEAAGLGLMRLAQEVEKRLNAMKTEVYQGQVMKGPDGKTLEFEDNGTRMRATELLADFHGKGKGRLEVSGPGGGPLRIMATPADEAM